MELSDHVAAFMAHDPAVIADPYPLVNRLRDEAPVYRHVDKVLVSGNRNVREVLTSPHVLQGLAAQGSRFRSAVGEATDEQRRQMDEMFEFLEQRLGGTNGKHHLRLRKLAQQAFSPRMVGQMAEQIEDVAERLLDPLAGEGEVEIISAYSYHLPLIVICELLDIPIEDRELLRSWANDLALFVGAQWTDPGVIARTHESVFRLKDYLAAVFDEHRDGTTSGLLAALIAAEEGGDSFTQDELVAMMVQFILAGHDTSTLLLGTALVLLLGPHRDQWEQMCDDPELIPGAVEELLRYETPTVNIDKLAAHDFEVAGHAIRAGETLSVILAGANRDPAVFTDPERFDIHRNEAPHVAFGYGAHHCLGATLARLEAQITLRLLSSQHPDLTLVSEKVEWRRSHMNRGPESLWVRFARQPVRA